MRKLNYSKIKLDYDFLYNLGCTARNKEKYNKSIKYFISCAEIAYYTNLKLHDDSLEKQLEYMSISILGKASALPPEKGKIIFHDSFSLDNKGLTQQYIRAIANTDFKVLYIVENNTNRNHDILSEISNYSNITVHIIPKDLYGVDKIKYMKNLISDYNPEKALLHLTPWSVEAFICWYNFKETTKFLINLTDHAFWIGKKCSNYFIEFRSYGMKTSNLIRGIPINRLLDLPFYPITNEDKNPFEGFPFQFVKDSCVIFTGGSYYKMYGRNNAFLIILKELIEKHRNLIILIAGSGNSKPIESFIKLYKLENNIKLIGSRKDIAAVFKRIDIYLNTYPLNGGLMSQLAVYYKKPLIGLADINMKTCYTEEFFLHNANNIKLTYFDIKEFYEAISNLIKSPILRDEVTSQYKNMLISPEDFKYKLINILKTKKITFSTSENKESNQKTELFDLAIEIENKYLKNYELLILQRVKYSIFLDSPFFFLKKAIAYIFKKLF
ncbi:glycosyltransferase family 4 protein [Providencia rettgeri]